MTTYTQDVGGTAGHSIYFVSSVWHRTFLGQRFNAGHTLIGETPTSLTVELLKNDTPNEQYNIVHIENTTFTKTVLASVDVSSLTNSFTSQTYTFSNCPELAAGDMLGVYAEGQTGSISGIYVRAEYASTDEDTNSELIQKADDTSGYATINGKDLKFSLEYGSGSGGGSGGGGEEEEEGDEPSGDGFPKDRLQILSTVVPR